MLTQHEIEISNRVMTSPRPCVCVCVCESLDMTLFWGQRRNTNGFRMKSGGEYM